MMYALLIIWNKEGGGEKLGLWGLNIIYTGLLKYLKIARLTGLVFYTFLEKYNTA